MITFSMMVFLLFFVVVLFAVWQLVVAPKKSMVAAMPGGIRRLRLANMVLIAVGFGPILALLAVKASGTHLAGFPTILAFVCCGLLCVILSKFGPLSTLLSDAYSLKISPESPIDNNLPSEKN
jgi:hypothetical protein